MRTLCLFRLLLLVPARHHTPKIGPEAGTEGLSSF